jgi:hypothetical protein
MALNSVLTPVMVVNGYLPISLTKPGMSRGLVISRLVAPILKKVRQFAVRAKM